MVVLSPPFMDNDKQKSTTMTNKRRFTSGQAYTVGKAKQNRLLFSEAIHDRPNRTVLAPRLERLTKSLQADG